MNKFIIDRNSPLPAYYQIALEMRKRIQEGEWRAGNKLPPEPDLAKQFQVSRMTVRQAISILVKERKLISKRGSGNYVARGYLGLEHKTGVHPAEIGVTEEQKSTLRSQVWDKLREVAIPDSRLHWNFEEFVPDFINSDRCAQSIQEMGWYRDSQTIFIAPDNSLIHMRRLAIQDNKNVIIATFGLARGFYLIKAGTVPKGFELFAATLDGSEIYGKEISLLEIKSLGNIDLLITGASLVTERGVRWGKGHGYFDLEWAMFREIGLVEKDTPVIAVGHDCQIISNDFEPSTVDTVVNAIVTPSRTIVVEKKYAKPRGVFWKFVSSEMLEKIPPLQALYLEQKDKIQIEIQ